MSARDAATEERAIVARVSAAVPDGWGAVIVLARLAPEGGLEVLTGGARLSKAISIKLLRELLRELEADS